MDSSPRKVLLRVLLTCWMWLLVKRGSLLIICLIAALRESPTRALQAIARIRSASVIGIFTDSRDRSTCGGHIWQCWMNNDSEDALKKICSDTLLWCDNSLTLTFIPLLFCTTCHMWTSTLLCGAGACLRWSAGLRGPAAYAPAVFRLWSGAHTQFVMTWDDTKERWDGAWVLGT